MKWYDAHCHLHDERLAPFAEDVAHALEQLPLSAAIVNGTREANWPAVRAYCERYDWAIPSFGLHPWYVRERTPAWREKLLAALDTNPRAAIGEIGLDRWVKDFDFPAQQEVFRTQMEIAAARDLPVAIHCLKAWGALEEQLRDGPRPARGFLLHSYGGPAEMIESFVRLGARFSFSPYFLQPRKAAAREVFRAIPLDRILLETDAPDMAPPAEQNPHPLTAGGHELNHPANIQTAYQGLAEIRGLPVSELAQAVAENFQHLFGECARPGS